MLINKCFLLCIRVAPPPGAAHFESRSSLRRKAKAERARQYAANDANRRADDQPVARPERVADDVFPKRVAECLS